MLGLTLEGGGSRSLFSCGIMDVLLDEGIMPDCLVGVSAGIVAGMSYLSRQRGRNKTLTIDFMTKKKYIGVRHLLKPWNRSIYNLKKVFYDIPEKLLPFDYDAFAEYPGKVFCVLTNLDTAKPEYIEVPRDDHRWLYPQASCALPILFPVYTINGTKYMDGGITDSIPYKKAFREGCDKNIVILTREVGYVKTTDKATEFAAKRFKRHKAFSDAIYARADMYNTKVAELEELERQGKIFLIRPDDTKGISRTDTNPEVLNTLYDKGVEMAKRRMPELKEYLKK